MKTAQGRGGDPADLALGDAVRASPRAGGLLGVCVVGGAETETESGGPQSDPGPGVGPTGPDPIDRCLVQDPGWAGDLYAADHAA